MGLIRLLYGGSASGWARIDLAKLGVYACELFGMEYLRSLSEPVYESLPSFAGSLTLMNPGTSPSISLKFSLIF